MQDSNISWCDKSWNPVHGCSRASKGCDNCYAERISLQYGYTDEEWTLENAEENVTMHENRLAQPYEDLDEPSTIFVNSMSDLFHSKVTDDFIQRVLAVCRNTPEHVYQVLTKRPGRAANMTIDWPPNVWLGTSVEDEQVTERIDLIRDADAETLFISFEPLVGPVGEVDLTGIDWAIAGGESGPDDVRREMDHEWARDIYHQCQEQDTAFYFKQSSARHPETGTRLTVERDFGGKTIYEQREIREMPQNHEAVEKARRAIA
jgi:protein gp37